MPRIELDGEVVEYSIKRSNRRKRLSIVALPTGIEVRVPSHTTEDMIVPLLKEKKAWILKQLKVPRPIPKAISFKTGEQILLFGTTFVLDRIPGRKTLFAPSNGKVILQAPSNASMALIYQRLVKFYKEQLEIYITKKIQELDGLRKPEKIEIRDYKRKWGACFSDGTIKLNWKLAMAPPRIIDYVLIHELVHLQIPNHQKMFWIHVAHHYPNYKEARNWLKQNQFALDIVPNDAGTEEASN